MSKREEKRQEAQPEKARSTRGKRKHDEQPREEDTATEAAGEEAFPDEMVVTREQFFELKNNIDNLQTERDEYLNDMKRMQAEFENYRKRNQSLRTDSIQEGVRDTVEAFLPVLDNLERAVVAAEKNSDASALIEGVKLVCKQFEDVLGKLDVEEIPTCEGFDPNVHNAIAQGEAEEGEQAGDIQEVFQKGYRQGEKVIRYSMVKVAQE